MAGRLPPFLFGMPSGTMGSSRESMTPSRSQISICIFQWPTTVAVLLTSPIPVPLLLALLSAPCYPHFFFRPVDVPLTQYSKSWKTQWHKNQAFQKMLERFIKGKKHTSIKCVNSTASFNLFFFFSLYSKMLSGFDILGPKPTWMLKEI